MSWMETTHELKCWPRYFEAIKSGRKTYEVRLNDRNFGEGDMVRLREFDPNSGHYSGRVLVAQIGYVLPLDDRGATGHVAFSLHGLIGGGA